MQADVCPLPARCCWPSRPSSARSISTPSASSSTTWRAGCSASRDEPRDASHRLATLLTDELRLHTDESSVDGIFLDTVLDRRAGHPLTLAVLAAEIGRRAGLAVGVCSTPTGWYAGLGERERLWLIDPPLDPGPTPSGPVRRHCGHEVGFAALTGVYARLIRDGEGARACRAAQLRGQLPVGRHV